MADKPLKVLLVADDLDGVALLEEAFSEIEEIRHSRAWIPQFELIPVDRLQEAVEALTEESFDVVLLDAAMLEGRILEAFSRLRAAAREVPVILLADRSEEAQAISLLRRGAQDYLIKEEIDCLPLARTLRAAIERQRLWNALEALALLDELTGLLTSAGLAQFADRHARLALAAGRRVELLVIELDPPYDTRDLLRAGEALSALFGENGLVARTGSARFTALAVTGAEGDLVDLIRERLDEVALRAAAVPWPHHEVSLEDRLEACERLLCDNGPGMAGPLTHAFALDDRPRRHL